MTQRNVEIMDIIVGKMAEGTAFSKALKLVYSKRNVCIPYNEDDFNTSLMELGMTARATNPLLRSGLKTIGDVVEFCKENKITDILNLGKTSGIEIFETILDYCWEHMTNDEKASFLIDVVERNDGNVRAEII